MTVASLFQTWEGLQLLLADPMLPDAQTDALVDQSMRAMLAITHTASDTMADVLLKLEICVREFEKGACDECDHLLASALSDRAMLQALSKSRALRARGMRSADGHL